MAEACGAAGDLDAWLAPSLDALGHKKRRTWAPVYLRGLLGPGERKSLQPVAAGLGLPGHDQLHHFVASPAWDDAPLWAVLAREADRLLGGPDAVLAIDDTALPKRGALSVGVARQYCGSLGKRANCRALVSLTRGRAGGGRGRRGGGRGQPRPRTRGEGPRIVAPARPQDDGGGDPPRGAGADPPQKSRLALAAAATGRFPVKRVADMLDVARPNLVDQLRHPERRSRGPLPAGRGRRAPGRDPLHHRRAADLRLPPRRRAAEPRQAGLRRAANQPEARPPSHAGGLADAAAAHRQAADPRP
jgi:DDE superfamily endonuclease